jgi:hypothetical protein
MFLTGRPAFARNYTTRRRRLSSITRAPCRSVIRALGQRATAALIRAPGIASASKFGAEIRNVRR